MSLRLADPPRAYSVADQKKVRADLVAEDRLTHKKDQDVDAGRGRFIIKDRVTGDRYALVVDAGVLDIEAL